jgi:hypothetical protein
MADKNVLVGVANEGEISLSVDVLKNWEVSKVSYFSDVVYFKSGDNYYSMKRNDFKEIFNK